MLWPVRQALTRLFTFFQGIFSLFLVHQRIKRTYQKTDYFLTLFFNEYTDFFFSQVRFHLLISGINIVILHFYYNYYFYNYYCFQNNFYFVFVFYFYYYLELNFILLSFFIFQFHFIHYLCYFNLIINPHHLKYLLFSCLFLLPRWLIIAFFLLFHHYFYLHFYLYYYYYY